MQKFASILLSDALTIYDVLEELATPRVLHDQIQLLACLYDLVQLDDRGVPHDFQDVYFTGHSLNIVHIDYLVFFQDFDGNFLPGEAMRTDHDLSKGALPEVSAQHVVAHDLTFLQIFDRRSRLASIIATSSVWISIFNLLHLYLLHHVHLGILLIQVDHGQLPSSPICATSARLCNQLLATILIDFLFFIVFAIVGVSIFVFPQRIKYILILTSILFG